MGHPSTSAALRLHDLPDGFVGRSRDMACLEALVRGGERLITVTGPPGMGKTRLARELIARSSAVAELSGGAELFACGAATDPVDVATLVAERLGAGAGGDPWARVVEAARRRGPTLLVLDEIEHLAPALGSLLLRLLEAPDLRILSTSRVVLGVPGERVHELGPLGLPQSDDEAARSESVELLLARAARRGVCIDPVHLPALAEIARRLDGIPLALELAAARLLVLDPKSLLARLDDRFAVLDGGGHDRTLRGAIEWSLELLSPAERTALACCTVFRGGFDAEAAEAVVDVRAIPDAPSTLDLLSRLRDRSLLGGAFEETGGALRLSTYLSVRELAAEELDEDAARSARARHARFMASRADGWRRRALETADPEASRRLAVETPNLLAAFDRAVAGEGPELEDGLVALLALEERALDHGPLAGYRARLAAVRPRLVELDDPALGVRALAALGHACLRLADGDGAQEALEEATGRAEALGDPTLEAICARHRTALADYRGQSGEALDWAQRAVELARAAGAPWLEGHALNSLGAVQYLRSALDAAVDTFEQALALHRRVGNRKLLATTLLNLGNACSERGEPAAARRHLSEALELAHELDIPRLEATARGALALVDQWQLRFDESEAGYLEAVASLEELSQVWLASIFRGYRAILALERGDAGGAFAMLSASGESLRNTADARHRALFDAWRALALALTGDLPGALALSAAAQGAIEPTGDVALATAVSLLAAGVDAISSGNTGLARDRIALARAPTGAGGRPPAEGSLDVRLAARAVERALASHADSRSCAALHVATDATWAEWVDGERIDLSRLGVARRLLATLSRRRLEAPGRALTPSELIDAAWPGQRLLPTAAKNRLHVAMSQLRKLGLRDVIVATDEGYLLDPDVPLSLGPVERP